VIEGRVERITPPERRAIRVRCLGLHVLLCAIGLLGLAAVARAQKTDVIVLANGDRVTGEIKYYKQGRITIDTSHSGWISIKWNKILSVESDKMYDVETVDGVHHFGSLAPSDPVGQLTIALGPRTLTVSFFEVFTLAFVGQKFWSRWEGSLDLGFNYTQSSNLVQFNLNGDATYRMRNYQVVTTLSSFFSRQDETTSADRASYALRYDRFLGNRWLAEGGFGLDRNIQLGLKLRASFGLGAGRFLVQENQKQLIAFAGVLGNHEQPVAGEGKLNAEAVVGVRYYYFMYDFPKITISSTLQVYPSITEGGRVRLEAAASAKREIVSDFYLSVSIYDSFDSREPTTGQAKNDWGPTLSIGWQF
jgi:hypothetical protein